LLRTLQWLGGSLVALSLLVLFLHQDREIQADTWIERPPAAVWQVLTATTEYPAWNPFIRRLQGELRPGGVLDVEIGPSDSSPMTFRPTVFVVLPNRELRWVGSLWIHGLFDGEHSFRLEPNGARTHFIQTERFSGLLVGRLSNGILDNTQRGFAAMNQALKQRAESH
jgi:hypothetical protein